MFPEHSAREGKRGREKQREQGNREKGGSGDTVKRARGGRKKETSGVVVTLQLFQHLYWLTCLILLLSSSHFCTFPVPSLTPAWLCHCHPIGSILPLALTILLSLSCTGVRAPLGAGLKSTKALHRNILLGSIPLIQSFII